MIAPLALAGCLFALWLLSLRLRDSSIIDLFWGPAFVLLAWLTLVDVDGPAAPRAWLVAGLVSAWGLRLGLYLTWRNHGRGEDPRYVAMRAQRGESWWWKSFFIVFGLQGVLAWVVSWPVRSAVAAPASAWSVLDVAGVGLVVVGVLFESLGDWQLARFKARPENKGRVMDQGLWRFTRHPNYFGDFVTWWGLGCFGLAVGAWWSLVGPVVMSVLLTKVSGKDLLEASLSKRPGYAEYVARTSGFFPWPPRGG